MNSVTQDAGRRRSKLRGDCIRSALLLLSVALTACQTVLDRLLEADIPGTVLDETLHNPANAGLLVDGARMDLYCAFADYTVVSGAVGDEIQWADLALFDFDRRTFNPSGGDRSYATTPCGTGIGSQGLGVFLPLSTARWSGENAHDILATFADADVTNGQRPRYLATVTLHSAYATLLLGEAMCEASINIGPRLTRRQIWEAAEAKFNAGLTEATAAGAADLVNLARVGRARTRINLATNPTQYGGSVSGKAAEALADAQAVTATTFVWNAGYSSTADTRSSNKVWWWNVDQGRMTIEDPYYNLTFQGVPDRRVTLTFTTRTGFDGTTRLVLQNKYPQRNSPIPLARYAEAQLIIAEVAGGQTAVAVINQLHTAAGLPSFASTDPTTIRNQVIEERKRELFLESQHLNDKIRFALPFTPATGTPYRSSSGGGTYGSGTCFPYPDEERLKNPNAS